MTPNHDALRRVAILVATLDTASADRLLDQMPSADATEVRRLLIDLEGVDSSEEQAVIADFVALGLTAIDGPSLLAPPDGVELCISQESSATDSSCQAEPVVAGEPTPRGAEPSFRFLEEVACERLAELLAAERPQTIALVISQLSESRALAMLAALPDTLQCEVVRRWIDLDETDPSLMREVEEELRARMTSRLRGERKRGAGLAQVAGVVQAAEPHLKEQLLSHLARCDATMASTISLPRLAFDDLEYLSDAGLASLLRGADSHTLVLALAGATETFAERIARQLPPPEAKRLWRSINSLGPTRLADVEAAQRALAGIAEKLLNQNDVIASPLPAGTAG